MIPALIDYTKPTMEIQFLKASIGVGTMQIRLPTLTDISVSFDSFASTTLRFNDQYMTIKPGNVVLAHLPVTRDGFSVFLIKEKRRDLLVYSQEVVWDEWTREKTISIENTGEITFSLQPLWLRADLETPVQNCSSPQQGEAGSTRQAIGVLYFADGYGVSCASAHFEGVTTDRSYLMRFTGENKVGRSIKLFVNDQDANIITKQFLLPQGSFVQWYTLPQAQTLKDSALLFNWETRSFKTASHNSLSDFSVTPVPLFQIGGVYLTPQPYVGSFNNEAFIQSHSSFDVAFHLIDISCDSPNCWFGLDQSYDDLWVALDLSRFKILSHYVLNGWANGWQLSQNAVILLVYVPELVALILFASVVGFMVYLVWRVYRTRSVLRKTVI
jgi:hypothetical protein